MRFKYVVVDYARSFVHLFSYLHFLVDFETLYTRKKLQFNNFLRKLGPVP